MGEPSAWRPVTPAHSFTVSSSSSLVLNEQASPLQNLLLASPHNSFGADVSSRSSSLSRRQSKTSLQNFFSRGRSTSGVSQRPDTSSSLTQPSTRSDKGSVARAESPHLSRVGSKLDIYRPTQLTHAAHLERVRNKTRRRRPSTCWDPPPLFQAFPQSLQHATLDASCISTEVILRKVPQKSAGGEVIADPLLTNLSLNMGLHLAAKPDSRKHTRKISSTISQGGWTKHLYVLMTCGYLLQYAGEGHHDRLPEKIMQLGRDTVAFASDAIPGKHWVLQISQTAGQETIVVPEPSKSILSRMGLQSAETRRTAQNFLMVFDNPDDLDSWLTAIRREVDALGGRQYRPQTPSDMEPQTLLEHSPNQKFKLQKEPHQFLQRNSVLHHQALSPVESEFAENDNGYTEDRTVDFHFWDNAIAAEQATGDSSTVTSTDLDRLRDSKDSTCTADTGTSASLQTRSSVSSPVCETFAFPPLPLFDTLDASTVLDAQISTAQKRESFVLGTQSPTFLLHSLEEKDQKEAQTELLRVPSHPRRASVGAPNFSVPRPGNRVSVNLGTCAGQARSSQDGATTEVSVPDEEETERVAADDEIISTRPLSTLAPLPSPENLRLPTGSRNRFTRQPSVEKKPPVPERSPGRALPKVPNRTRALSSDDMGPGFIPKRYSSLDHNRSLLATRTPPPNKELPPLPPPSPSISEQARSTGAGSSTPRQMTSFLDTSSKGDAIAHRVSLSGFPQPPTKLPQPTSPPVRSPMLTLKPMSSTRSSTKTSSASSRGVNARLAKIRDDRCVPKLGLFPGAGPPSGPPPSIPLPDTPSPRRRHFRPKVQSSIPSARPAASIRPFRKASTHSKQPE